MFELGFNLEQFVRTYVTKRQESLLKADYERCDDEMHKRIDGKKVLVIGGAGSIGSHYIKAILRYSIRTLVVVDTNENGLTELVRDLRSNLRDFRIPEDFTTYPINFGDSVFKKIFLEKGPFDVIANFAAHKHVRSEKDVFSIEAMINNNVLQARSLLDFLLKHPPEAFFCVSTDKAANPVNIMGASKKLMEEMIMTYAVKMPIKTARFANVAFSNGSLPLGFLERIAKHQPISCPLGIKRFFVSPIESGELCLMASIMGLSGEIIYPKMDESRDMVSFEIVLRNLLDALGLGIDVCHSSEEAREKAWIYWHTQEERRNGYPVELFQSDTSGEKPFEEFYTEGEVRDTERFINLGVIKNAPRRTLAELDEITQKIEKVFSKQNATKEEIVEVLREYLPNFKHIEKGKGLDSRM